MPMKILFFLTSLISLNLLAADPEALISDFKSLASQYSISPVKEQVFCYADDSGVQGYQVDKLQRIASVTKLIVSYMASETLDLKKSYQTKLYIAGDRLHIEGGLDPYFEEEKVLLMMDALNRLGYKSFRGVTFNKAFSFSDIALDAHAETTPAETKSRLGMYFNANNKTFVKTKWAEISKFASEEGVQLGATVPTLNALSIAQSEVNPLANKSYDVYVHNSRPVHAIMKSMNVMSKNRVAHNLYLEAGKVKSLDLLMAQIGVDKKFYQIFNGSGLPVISGQTRKDNLASCRVVLKVISSLVESLKKHSLEPSDVMAVNGGKDLGSFRSRFQNYPETHEAVLSKTGTLKHSSALAGLLLIGTNVPFAILNHTTNVSQARLLQEEMVSRLFHHLGEPTPIDYTKLSIFPWTEADFLELRH